MPKKKFLTKKDEGLETISIWDFDGSMDDIIYMLESCRNEWLARGYSEVGIEPMPDSENLHFSLYGLRPETNEERDERLSAVKQAREDKARRQKEKEVDEMKELERLLEKHGDKLKDLLK